MNLIRAVSLSGQFKLCSINASVFKLILESFDDFWIERASSRQNPSGIARLIQRA